jgi:hypothetical protein
MKLVLVFFVSFVVIASMGCRHKRLHPVPDLPFNVAIDINLPLYSGLQSIGGYSYIDHVGVKGVVIYRQTMYDFVAFDRMSTASGGDTCAPIYVDPNDLLTLLDPCTSSKWSLFSGALVEGPADWGLRGYLIEFNGSNILNIRN